MKVRLVIGSGAVAILMLAVISHLPSQPSFNGSAPGCGGGGCHTFQAGKVSALPQSGLQVRVTVSGTTANVAGELVDSTGTVVAVIDRTSSNPFTLTAPRAGTYTVNAGHKDPQRQWDSVRVTVLLTGVEALAGEKPDGVFSLDQNYPNPFNPGTSISFTIPRAAFTTLIVYSSLGEEVAQVVSAHLGAGSHVVTFRNPGLASGIYMYRLESGGYSATRKLLVMK